jgi:F-type H+-transporting ATPase subunit epsilon
MAKLNLKIATPEKEILNETGIDSITLPTTAGEITILPEHIPLISGLSSGEITYKKDNQKFYLAVTQGFLRLDKEGNLLLLADYAVRSEDVVVEEAEAAKKRAETVMKERPSEEDMVLAEAELRKALLDIKISQRKRNIKI